MNPATKAHRVVTDHLTQSLRETAKSSALDAIPIVAIATEWTQSAVKCSSLRVPVGEQPDHGEGGDCKRDGEWGDDEGSDALHGSALGVPRDPAIDEDGRQNQVNDKEPNHRPISEHVHDFRIRAVAGDSERTRARRADTEPSFESVLRAESE